MGSYSGVYFDNIMVDCEEDAAPSVFRILFRPADFLQVPLRKLPNHLRAYCKRTYDFDSNSQIYSVLCGSTDPTLSATFVDTSGVPSNCPRNR